MIVRNGAKDSNRITLNQARKLGSGTLFKAFVFTGQNLYEEYGYAVTITNGSVVLLKDSCPGIISNDEFQFEILSKGTTVVLEQE